MTDLLQELQDHVLFITFNRVEKHNAFNESFLGHLQILLEAAEHDSNVRVIVLKSNGRHFSAGADAEWMQRMARFSEAENKADAQVLARLMYTLHRSSKPTVAMVHGAAFGGGAGFVAACDIAIAADTAQFCFSEVKLGLIPAVISPYVVRAIGAKAATWLFMSAETINAQRALELQLIQHQVPEEELLPFTEKYAQHLAQSAPQAVRECKTLVDLVSSQPLDEALIQTTASLIAEKRVSEEAQRGLQAFLTKNKPHWD